MGFCLFFFTLPRFSTGTVSSTASESPGSVGGQNTQGAEGWIIEDLNNFLYVHPHKFSKMVLGRKFYEILQGTRKIFNFYIPTAFLLLLRAQIDVYFKLTQAQKKKNLVASQIEAPVSSECWCKAFPGTLH